MDIIIVSIHVGAAVILVLTVLLQAGKGAGMGAAFGGSSGTVFGARGPATLISKITCGAAVVFMCTSLNLAISQGGLSKKGSVMDEWTEPAPLASPVAPAPPEAMATPAPVPSSGDSRAAAPVPEPSAAGSAASPAGPDSAAAAAEETETQ
ncbi:MAG: preprotein translocase subunit SecG [Candidatus Adiutrix sp.]|jgi:preprotein translocase subunit SecG|nr:preprotein translocase subunit SecG [Candidatus Adiutrix sp.]